MRNFIKLEISIKFARAWFIGPKMDKKCFIYRILHHSKYLEQAGTDSGGNTLFKSPKTIKKWPFLGHFGVFSIF